MTLRSLTTAMFFAATAATAAMAPAPLRAQITTFVAPPRKAAMDSAKATVATAAAAKADTTARMKLSDMKAWVDSAAGVSTTQVATADTTTFPVNQPTSSSPSSRASATATTSFSNGAIAPNTASPLPFYFAGGFILILLGMGTLRLARRRA